MAKTKEKNKKEIKLEFGEGSIFKRSDGRYAAKYQVNGKAKTFYGKTPEEVAEKLKDFKKLLKANINIEFHEMSFEDYIKRWLKLTKTSKLKDSSYDRVLYTIDNNIKDYIGHYKLKDIDSDIIQNLINELMLKPSPVYKDKTLSYSTIKKVYEALNGCFRYAIMKKHIADNPMLTVELPSKHKFEKKEMQSYTDEEVKKIIEVASTQYSNKKYKYPMGVAVIILFNTGIRLGELLGLKWKDVDFDKKIIHINKNVSVTNNSNKITDEDKKKKYEVIVNDTVKTQSSNRSIPLNENAINALNIIKSIRYFGEDSFVVSSSVEGVTSPDTFKRTFKTIVDKANVPKYGVHATRHTFASKLFREGKDVKVISQLLGHSSVTVTYNTYVHVIEEQKASTIQVLDDLNWS